MHVTNLFKDYLIFICYVVDVFSKRHMPFAGLAFAQVEKGRIGLNMCPPFDFRIK